MRERERERERVREREREVDHGRGEEKKCLHMHLLISSKAVEEGNKICLHVLWLDHLRKLLRERREGGGEGGGV